MKGGGSYTVDLDGEVVLTEEDLQIFTHAAEGYAVAQDGGVTVALNTRLTEQRFQNSDHAQRGGV